MAKATKVIHKMKVDPEKRHQQEYRELEMLLTEHKDALADVLAIADKMKEHGSLDMVDSSLGQSDKVIHRIVTALDDSNTPQSIKNVLLLFQLLGTLDMTEIEPIVLKLNTGISKAAEYEHKNTHAGYSGILNAFKDPEVIEGTNVLLKILKGLGTQKEDEENVEPQTERTHQPEKEMGEQSKTPTVEKSSKQYGYALAAGAGALLMVPLIFLRK